MEEKLRKYWPMILAVIAALAVAILFWFMIQRSSPPPDISEDEANGEEQPDAEGKQSVFAVYGDSRDGHEVHRDIIADIEEFFPDAIFHTGDLVNSGDSEGDWQRFDEVTSDVRSRIPFYPALGNHEGDGEMFREIFDLPGNEQWYTVTLGEVVVIVLNSCVDLSADSEQYMWLSSTLSNVSAETESIAVVFHHPIYSTGNHGDGDSEVRDTLVPLFEQYGVDVVFNGHDHDYERLYVDGIYYIVTGGGGAPLRPQAGESEDSQVFLMENHFGIVTGDEDSFDITIYDTEENILDEVFISTPD